VRKSANDGARVGARKQARGRKQAREREREAAIRGGGWQEGKAERETCDGGLAG